MLFFVSNVFITYARGSEFWKYYLFAFICPLALVCIYLHSTKLLFNIKLYFNLCLAFLSTITAIYWVDTNNIFSYSLASSFLLVLVLNLFFATIFTYLFHFILQSQVRNVVQEWGPTIFVALIFGLNLNPAVARAFDVDGDSAMMVVSSESMEPTFYKGDVILIKGTSKEEIAMDDIIVYDSPHEDVPIVHRVVAIQNTTNQTYFVTQGDNRVTNPINDTVVFNQQGDRLSPTPNGVREEDTHGEVVGVVPIIGWVKIILTGGF